MGPQLSETSSSTLGKALWEEHQKTVSLFWASLSQFFNSLDNCGFKIYQDGLISAGKDGLNIVNEGVRQGSTNYEIISSLIHRGAILIQTEDITLVQKEINYLKKLISAKSTRERETAASRYKLAQRKLLEDRDNFIASAIENSLKGGDTGILFIGAYHQVLAKLAPDIRIVQVKEESKVKEYHGMLINMTPHARTRFQQLSEYLISPVKDLK